jgi:hypothetical protein
VLHAAAVAGYSAAAGSLHRREPARGTGRRVGSAVQGRRQATAGEEDCRLLLHLHLHLHLPSLLSLRRGPIATITTATVPDVRRRHER